MLPLRHREDGCLSLDVRSWLERNGFGQYSDLFDARRIDTDDLTALTDQRLCEMGIPLGPRLKLLAALARTTISTPSRSSWPNAAGSP